MKDSFGKAHHALANAMDEGLGKMAKEHADVSSRLATALDESNTSQAKALEEYAATHAKALAEHADAHSEKLSQHSATLDKGMEDIHARLSQEVTNLRADHTSKLEQTSSEMDSRIDGVTLNLVTLGKNMTEHQDEIHASLRTELEKHGQNAEEMKSVFQAAHEDLSKTMTEGHEKLSAEQAKAAAELKTAVEEQAAAHAKALEEHAAAHTKAMEEHASTHATALADMDKTITGKLEKLNDDHTANHDLLLNKLGDHIKEAADNKAAAEEAHSSLSKTMDEGFESMASSHAKALMEHKEAQEEKNVQIMEDVAGQIDTVTLSMVTLGKNVTESQQASDAAFRNDLAEHGKNAAAMKAEWDERHSAMSKTMDDSFSKLAADHAEAHEKLSNALEDKHATQQKALEDHASAHAKALAEHAEAHGARLSDVETTMTDKHKEMKVAWDHMFDGWRKCMDNAFPA